MVSSTVALRNLCRFRTRRRDDRHDRLRRCCRGAVSFQVSAVPRGGAERKALGSPERWLWACRSRRLEAFC